MKVRSPILITCCIFKMSVQYCSILAKPCLATALNGYERSMYSLFLWCNFLVIEVPYGEAKPLPPFFSSLLQLSSSCSSFLLNGNRLTIGLLLFFLSIYEQLIATGFTVVPVLGQCIIIIFFFLWGWTFLCIIPVTKNPISLCLKEKQICGVLWGSPSKQWSWACL